MSIVPKRCVSKITEASRGLRCHCTPLVVYDVGVTTKLSKLYFAIFAAFNESLTVNLAQRLFKVIHFGGNRFESQCATLYRP